MSNITGLGPASYTLMSQRLQLRYVDWGNEDAPPLILVHGGKDHCRNWDWIAEDLRHDWHVIAPDLRGHGDSAYAPDGHYAMELFIYDLAQLIRQQGSEQVSIIGHSMGGNISLRYTGFYPERVRRLVAIEGLGTYPHDTGMDPPISERMRQWIEAKHALSARIPRRYGSIEEGCARMISENKHLVPDRARHLTRHGMKQNEDGSYSWKFDNYINTYGLSDLTLQQLSDLYGRIACPTLLVYGKQSWATSPAEDGRLALFNNARLSMYDNAGHWVHHDQHEKFVAEVREFLK